MAKTEHSLVEKVIMQGERYMRIDQIQGIIKKRYHDLTEQEVSDIETALNIEPFAKGPEASNA